MIFVSLTAGFVPFENLLFFCLKSQYFYTWLLFTKKMFQYISHSVYHPFFKVIRIVEDACISLNKYSE